MEATALMAVSVAVARGPDNIALPAQANCSYPMTAWAGQRLLAEEFDDVSAHLSGQLTAGGSSLAPSGFPQDLRGLLKDRLFGNEIRLAANGRINPLLCSDDLTPLSRLVQRFDNSRVTHLILSFSARHPLTATGDHRRALAVVISDFFTHSVNPHVSPFLPLP